MLIVHEVMGRNCGWLTAATAPEYRKLLDREEWLPGLGLDRDCFEVHGVFIPEMEIDLAAEAERLRSVMDSVDNVNIFISEGAGVEAIVAEMQAKGQEVPRDAFGHIKLDAVNPGKWFGEQFAQDARRRKDPGAEVRLFCPRRRRQRRRHPPDQILRRPGGRMRACAANPA